MNRGGTSTFSEVKGEEERTHVTVYQEEGTFIGIKKEQKKMKKVVLSKTHFSVSVLLIGTIYAYNYVLTPKILSLASPPSSYMASPSLRTVPILFLYLSLYTTYERNIRYFSLLPFHCALPLSRPLRLLPLPEQSTSAFIPYILKCKYLNGILRF